MNKETIIGAHNCMTAYKPIGIFGKLFNIFAKCQNKEIDILLREGIRCFDIRIVFKKNKIIYSHGLINYDGPKLRNVLYHFNQYNNIYVRLILEKGKYKDMIDFAELCKVLEKSYPNVTFLGGNYKPNWAKLYTFSKDIKDKDVYQWVSSMQDNTKWYEKLIPKCYAKRMNDTNNSIAKVIKGIHLFDFI